MAVCLFGQRTIFMLLATTQVKSDVIFTLVDCAVKRFLSILSSFPRFLGSTRTFVSKVKSFC